MYGAVAARSSDAGRLIGRVSKAIRFTSNRCRGEILSEVTLPPQEPHPRVIDGSRSVVNPIAPWVEGLDTITREAGIRDPYSRAAFRSRVCMEAVWPMPPYLNTSAARS